MKKRILTERDKEIFRKKIKRLREDRGLNQSQVAKLIGVEQTSYMRYENGQIVPRWSKLEQIAKTFDVDVSYLFDSATAFKYEKNEDDISFSVDIYQALSECEQLTDTQIKEYTKSYVDKLNREKAIVLMECTRSLMKAEEIIFFAKDKTQSVVASIPTNPIASFKEIASASSAFDDPADGELQEREDILYDENGNPAAAMHIVGKENAEYKKMVDKYGLTEINTHIDGSYEHITAYEFPEFPGIKVVNGDGTPMDRSEILKEAQEFNRRKIQKEQFYEKCKEIKSAEQVIKSHNWVGIHSYKSERIDGLLKDENGVPYAIAIDIERSKSEPIVEFSNDKQGEEAKTKYDEYVKKGYDFAFVRLLDEEGEDPHPAPGSFYWQVKNQEKSEREQNNLKLCKEIKSAEQIIKSHNWVGVYPFINENCEDGLFRDDAGVPTWLVLDAGKMKNEPNIKFSDDKQGKLAEKMYNHGVIQNDEFSICVVPLVNDKTGEKLNPNPVEKLEENEELNK